MPKFMTSIIVVSTLLWTFLIYLVVGTLPNSYSTIFLFLGVLFFATGFTLSIPFYFIYRKKLPNFTNTKLLYRKSLKWGTFIGFGVVGTAFLKALNLINPLNVGLFFLLYAGIFFQTKGKR